MANPDHVQTEPNNDDSLVLAVRQIKEARDRDSRTTDDGGSSGRTDSNDNAIF